MLVWEGVLIQLFNAFTKLCYFISPMEPKVEYILTSSKK
jgi:hypothetical protein